MTTWILLRGLTRESGHWGDFPEHLRNALPEARVVTLDLPGNGDLFQEPSPCRVEAMAAHGIATARRRGLAPPYTLLAMSLGAMVAVAWAAARPQEVDRCVLISTSLRPFSPFYRRLRPGSYLPLLQLIAGTDARRRERTVLRLTSRLHIDDPAVVDAWTALREAHPVSARNALCQLLAAARYRAPAARPTATLLLAGAGDALVHPGCSQALAAAWQCPLREHPRAGHDLPLDDAPWVAEQVRHWLAGDAAPGAGAVAPQRTGAKA
ncbi:alpha/beta fold hydrolase [Denitromonas iodatirespirans]|uniref:Alpha/beta hydrolase n=1 Tax=Denitromonas iodatirespirans TaxID=2795389 RepID=A0A944HB71_DENI1|nr:alpha/beta hydrolase [Denitromonas iodatirespirans]MBT0960026.1 alpha/beta hydrolase [Denitromonas iodatirespirans]